LLDIKRNIHMVLELALPHQTSSKMIKTKFVKSILPVNRTDNSLITEKTNKKVKKMAKPIEFKTS